MFMVFAMILDLIFAEVYRFFHALTGCDTTSSFYKVGKGKFWNKWMEMNKHSNSLTNVFQQLSDQPKRITPDILDTIAKFIYHVYYPNQRQKRSFSQMRMQQLIKTPDVNMRLLVPSIAGILQHISDHASKQDGSGSYAKLM